MYSRYRQSTVIITGSFLLLSCASAPHTPDANLIASAVSRPLAANFGPARLLLQSIDSSWQGQTKRVLCQIELNQAHLAMAAVNEQSLSLFNLNYNGKDLSLTASPLLNYPLTATSMVADFQLSVWPASLLKQALPNEWQLQIRPHLRQLFYRQTLIAEAQYPDLDSVADNPLWQQHIKLHNYQYHYQLDISPLQHELLPE